MNRATYYCNRTKSVIRFAYTCSPARRKTMRTAKTTLTDCEQLVMKVIWKADEELTLPDIVQSVNATFKKDWKPQTVSTFLARLVRKGYLNSYRSGRTFFYKILVDEEEYRGRVIESCVEFWSNNNAGDMLCALHERRKLRKDEIARIQGLIDELR